MGRIFKAVCRNDGKGVQSNVSDLEGKVRQEECNPLTPLAVAQETERMKAIVTELTKLGAQVEEGRDYCVITPPDKLRLAAIDTYDDHRMAMAFSLAACGDVPVTINDPGCTRKTFPSFFSVLDSVLKPK